MELTPAAAGDALFDGLPRRFQAMQWHYYACRPSNGAVELMTNPVSLQALRVGDAAWGTQFHIEVTRAGAADAGWRWAATTWPRTAIRRDRFLESLDQHLETHQQVGRTLADRFARFATRPAG